MHGNSNLEIFISHLRLIVENCCNLLQHVPLPTPEKEILIIKDKRDESLSFHPASNLITNLYYCLRAKSTLIFGKLPKASVLLVIFLGVFWNTNKGSPQNAISGKLVFVVNLFAGSREIKTVLGCETLRKSMFVELIP